MGKILDGLPMSLGQTQHEQICHQWPNSVPKNDHLHYNRDPVQNTHHKMVRPMKAKFKGIADIANVELQGQYSPIDTVQQITTTNGQQVKGEVIEQSIKPIYVIPTLQTHEMTGLNDGPHCLTQIFQHQQRNIYDPNMYTPMDHPPHRIICDH